MRTLRTALALAALATAATAQAKVDYVADVKFAIDALGRECKDLLALKQVDWPEVTAPFLAEAQRVKTHEAQLVLLVRLVARLQDGHAEVRPLEAAGELTPAWPDRSAGPGFFLCQAQGKWYVKNVWGPAQSAGIEAGQELVSVDGVAAARWLEGRRGALQDLIAFSTPQQAEFYAAHWGLADAAGTRWKLVLRDARGKSSARTLALGKSNQVARGPAYPPADLSYGQSLGHGRTAAGYGYLHVRRCREEIVAELDAALATLRDVPGLILDFRGNSGGGFDHEAFFGRFIPAGKEIAFAGVKYTSAGPWSYGGPLVGIVDATVRSAGETAAGMFKEDGRGYVIGESATAGMSSQKTDIELPSKLFALRVSTRSNKQRWQGGRGLEGLGLEPHERVAFEPADLAAGRDTLILRAEELLREFPARAVPYKPADFGWSAPAK